jgi:hypothetical protein
MITACPDKYATLANWCDTILGLDDFEIRVKEADAPNNNPDTDGVWVPETRYLRGKIEIRRDVDVDEIERVIVHEFVHVALAQVDQTVEQRIIELLPEGLQDHARALYLDSLESTVERISRALCDNLQRKD